MPKFDKEVDSAKCPYCQGEFGQDELAYMDAARGSVEIIVCPECNTMLTSVLGDESHALTLAWMLAEDIDEAGEFVEALVSPPEETDSAVMDEMEKRMGSRTD